MIAETSGTGGITSGGHFPLPYVYDVPNSRRQHTDVRVNGGNARAMRAPGHPQGCAMMESAVDDLAEKLGIDPLEVRLTSLADRGHGPQRRGRAGQPHRGLPRADRAGPQGHRLGPPQEPGRERQGQGADQARLRHGPAPVGRRRPERQAGRPASSTPTARSSSGPPPRTSAPAAGPSWPSSPPRSSAWSPRTSPRTSATPQFPPGQASGGSTTTPSMAPPTYNAALKARDAFLKKIAGAFDAEPERPAISAAATSSSRASARSPGRRPAASSAPCRSTSPAGSPRA